MANLIGELASGRSAVNDMIAAAEHAASRWTNPRAPGKWSPSQVVEHVARALDESAKAVEGVPTDFPTVPSFVRPVVRGIFSTACSRTKGFRKPRPTGR
jgi:hypothetical protein